MTTLDRGHYSYGTVVQVEKDGALTLYFQYHPVPGREHWIVVVPEEKRGYLRVGSSFYQRRPFKSEGITIVERYFTQLVQVHGG